MNQPNTLGYARAAGVADAPDILFVLRRYVWVIIGGVLLGTLIAAGLYIYIRITAPRYTASVTFQVLPPPSLPGTLQTAAVESSISVDEINRFIHRQMDFISRDVVLDAALQNDAFQHDPAENNQRSRWLVENSDYPKKHLKHDMVVTANPNSELFTISMTTTNNEECARLVNAIADVYLDALKTENQQMNNSRIGDLHGFVEAQKKTVNDAQAEIKTLRQSNNVADIAAQHGIETTLLGQMNTEMMQIQSGLASAKQMLDTVSKEANNGTLTLSAEEEQMVENDPELRTLDGTRLQLMQDRAVAIGQAGGNSPQLRALDARIHAVEGQIQESRDKLRRSAQLRMAESAENNYKGLQAQAGYFSDAWNKQSKKVQDLDYFLVGYNQKVDDLKVQQDILDKLTQQSTLQTLQTNTDDSRVRKFAGKALAPDVSDISSPLWYYYFPIGIGGGLLLSFSLAYIFELTNTRVRTPRDVSRTMQMPLLGFVPDQDDDAAITGELSTAIRTAPASMIAESFRQIRTRLIAEANGTPVTSLLVASIAPGGGATTVASNLATGMAINGKRVLLVDANFYRPGLQGIYRNIPAVGLSNIILGSGSITDAIIPSTELANLHVMGVGSESSKMNAEILDTKAFLDILATLKQSYDIIIFDGAPLSLVSDSITLGARVDGVVGVVRAGEVTRGTVTRVRDQLRHIHANFLGIVLNAAQTHGAGYFKENYRSFYQYAGKRGPNIEIVPSA